VEIVRCIDVCDFARTLIFLETVYCRCVSGSCCVLVVSFLMNVLASIEIVRDVSLMLSTVVRSRLTLADNSSFVGRCNTYSNKLPYKNFPSTFKYMCIFSETVVSWYSSVTWCITVYQWKSCL